MSDKTAALMASARLGGVIQGFRAKGSRRKRLGSWGFAGGTVLSAFRALQALDVSHHRGFWMSPALKQFN